MGAGEFAEGDVNLDAEAHILLKQVERFVSAKGRETVFNRLRVALDRLYRAGRQDGEAHMRSLLAPMHFAARFVPEWTVKFQEVDHG